MFLRPVTASKAEIAVKVSKLGVWNFIHARNAQRGRQGISRRVCFVGLFTPIAVGVAVSAKG